MTSSSPTWKVRVGVVYWKAVPLRRARGYWFLVWAFRCQPIALALGGLTAASTLVKAPLLTAVLAACVALVMFPAVVLGLTGLVVLYVGGLMPREMDRRQAMAGMLWRDIVRPLKRPGGRQQR